MKYALSSRQHGDILELCDEITVAENDHDYIFTLAERYSEKSILLRCEDFSHISIDLIKNYQIITKNKLKVVTSSIYNLRTLIDEGIPSLSSNPVSTFYELRALKDIGVCQVVLAPPLFFSMDQIKKFGIAVRAIPNVANLDVYPRSNGVHGSWIRPEDVSIYEPYIEILQFQAMSLKQEETLFRIYQHDGTWPGNLDNLVLDLQHSGSNRFIKGHMDRRLNCKQKCEEDPNSCRYCNLILQLANPAQLKEYARFLKGELSQE